MLDRAGTSSRNWHAKDGSNFVPVAHLAWRAARPFQPLRKIHQLDRVLEADVRHRHPDDVEPLSDSGNPLVATDRREPRPWATASYSVAVVTSTFVRFSGQEAAR